MPDSRLTGLTALTVTDPSDLLYIVDDPSGTALSRKITLANLLAALGTPTTLVLTNATNLPVSTGLTGLGTNVATALAVNVGSAGAPVVNGGVLGTPSSGTATNMTGLPPVGLIATWCPQGRLTLTTATPWMAASVTAQTTVYYTPAVGNIVPIYNGTAFIPTTFTELSQLTTDNTKSPAAVANNSNYDVFVWSDAGTVRATRGPAWTSDTGRGTGAATTELEFVKGLLVNKIAITNGPSAQRGTYVGSVRSNGSAQIDAVFGGAGVDGGEDTRLGLWNMYNREAVALVNYDTTDSWVYTTATWRIKNGDDSNRTYQLIGWLTHRVVASNTAIGSNTTADVFQANSIGVNSTSAFVLTSANGIGRSSVSGATHSSVARYAAIAPLGWNYFAPLEISTASGASTWYGDNAGGNSNSVFIVETMY